MSKLAHSHQPTMDQIDALRVLDDGAMDQEADGFAMELLMPEHFLREDMKGVDIADDRSVARLANKYRVPAATMAIRIGQLRATSSMNPTAPPPESTAPASSPVPEVTGA